MNPFLLSILMLLGSTFSLHGQTAGSYFGSMLGTAGLEEGSGIVSTGDFVYLTGTTSDSTFPVTPGLLNDSLSGGYDVFLACFDTTGALIWSTLFGGMAYELAPRLAINASNGFLVVCGYTSSTDFPVTSNAHQTQFNGSYDAFIFCTDLNGNLQWSTLYGGSGGDLATDLSIPPSGNILIGGQTTSTDFPCTSGSFRDTLSGAMDAFILSLNPTGNLVYAGYFGGTDIEDVHAVTSNQSGDIFITGMTASTDLPVSPGAFQTGLAGGLDIYIAGFTASGNYKFSSYLGGAGYDDALGISVDDAGNLYLAGKTGSHDFPLSTNAWQDSVAGGFDGFISAFAPNASLIFSSYLGGPFDEEFTRIRTGSDGIVALLYTLNDSLDSFGNPSFPYGNYGVKQPWILKFLPDFERKFSTYLPSDNSCFPADLFVKDSTTFFAGYTYSSSLPFLNPGYYQNQHLGGGDVFWAGITYRIGDPENPGWNELSQNHNALTIHPNPARDFIHLNVPGQKIEKVVIFDQSGREVYVADNNFNIKVNGMEAGIYLINVQIASGSVFTERLIVLR